MLITQAEVLRATDSAHSNLILPLSEFHSGLWAIFVALVFALLPSLFSSLSQFACLQMFQYADLTEVFAC